LREKFIKESEEADKILLKMEKNKDTEKKSGKRSSHRSYRNEDTEDEMLSN
jgi:hypothetical protein